jgi:phosphate transport system ATP-binding protein
MIDRVRADAPALSPPARGTVEFVGFSAWFGKIAALRAVDLALAPTRVTALIGPSGCGKSTLLRAINRLNDGIPGVMVRGAVLLDGVDLYANETDTSALRQRVGMVFQRSTPFPRSIFDNVAYGPRLNALVAPRDIDDRVEGALQRAALWDEVKDRLRDSALTLSGGQQQRLCIARALANDPEVLLLDEPTSALDPTATQRIEELLYELKRDLTIVLVTHNLHQAARVSDATVFLDDGRVVEVGATRAIFTGPRDARTEAFITGRFG